MPGPGTKYTMDNPECYRGFWTGRACFRDLGEENQSRVYVEAARRIVAGNPRTPYTPLPERGVYAWSLSLWYGRRFPRRGSGIPDAVSQADLIYCGKLSLLPALRRKAIWEGQ